MKAPVNIFPLLTLIILTQTMIGQKEIMEDVKSISDSLITNSTLSSLAVGIINNGKVYTLYSGKLGDESTPDDNTLYEIASLTKTFTGTLLAKAIVQGKVKLDDDIREFLPGDYPNLEYLNHPITFKHLVTHTSGLPRMFPDHPELFQNPDWDKLPNEINKLQKDYTRVQFLKDLKQVTIDTIPGYKFQYSNAGANLVGYCLEQIYKKTYKELIEEHILKPLEMKNTYIFISKEKEHLVVKGKNQNDIEMPIRANKELVAEGGIISTVSDMLKYMQYHLKNNDLVISTSHQELFEGKYGDFENGLFWQIFKNQKSGDLLFQNGGAYGTSSWISLIPEKQIGVIIITDRSAPEVHQQLNMMADKILNVMD